jgi:hypothetical protein
MNTLAEQFSKITAHMANMEANFNRKLNEMHQGPRQENRPYPPRRCPKCQGTHMERICPDTVCFRCNRKGHLASTCNEQLRCSKCGENGHTERRCNSESSRMAQPARNNQSNVVRFEVEDPVELISAIEAYPVASGSKPGRPARTPSPYRRPATQQKGKEPEVVIPVRRTTPMEEIEEPDIGQKIQEII